MTYYAWSNFVVERNEHNQPTKTIECGGKITQSALGVSDGDWKDLIDAGAIREEPYPENLPSHVSPLEMNRSKIVPKTDTFAELHLPVHKETAKAETDTASVLDKALGLG